VLDPYVEDQRSGVERALDAGGAGVVVAVDLTAGDGEVGDLVRAAGGEQANIQRNGSINTIYMSDPGLPGGQPFVSVLDAIQGDGFNPLWEEVQIAFTAGHTPRQLLSDNDVLAAAAAGEITLTVTTELYRCSVVGPK